MNSLAPGEPLAAEDIERIKADGSCRRLIGVWGDKSCAELPAQVHCRNCPVYARAGKRLLDREITWAAARAQDAEKQTGQEATRSVIVFRAGAEWLALPTTLAREVVAAPPAHRVPHRNDPRFAGLVNVRGELMPLVDVRAMLGVAEAADEQAQAANGREHPERVLILERDGAGWALRVDEIDDIRRIPASALRPPPVSVELSSPRFTQAMFELPRGQVGLIDDELFWYALGEVCR